MGKASTTTGASSSSSSRSSDQTERTGALADKGRLRYCYDRMEIGDRFPSDDELRDTPPLVIATNLGTVLSERARDCAESGRSLPEQSYVAVMDAYMVAYRRARREKGGKEEDHRTPEEYEKEMTAVVEGMQSAMSVLNHYDEHDSNATAGGRIIEARTVEPYANVLHMLLGLTLSDERRLSHRWCARSLRVLKAMESNPVLLSNPAQASLRLTQYHRVLQGLASQPDTIGEAVGLLDTMLSGNTHPGNSTVPAGDGLAAVQTALRAFAPGPGIVPKPKTFLTVLESPFFENDNDARRLIESSVSFGIFEGFMEKSLKTSFGEERLSELMQQQRYI